MSIASRITSIEGHISDIYDSVELTGVDTTDIDKNLVNVPNTLKEGYIDIINNGTDTLYNNFPKVSGEGTSLTLNNTYQAPMRNNLKGNTSQTGTPTPSSPIPVNVVSGDNSIVVCGKNLINMSTSTSGKYVKASDGTINNSSNAFATDYIEVIEGQPYYFSGMTTLNNGNTGAMYNANKEYVGSIPNDSNIRPLTIPSNVKYIRLSIWKNNYSDTTNPKPMLELGSTATTYEPYQGNTYNIDLPVENLLNLTQVTLIGSGSTQSNVQTNSITLNGKAAWSNTYFLITNTNKNTNYTASCKAFSSIARKSGISIYGASDTSGSGLTPINGVMEDMSANVSKTYINSFNSGNYEYLAIRLWTNATGTSLDSNVDLNISEIMLQKGSKANSYTPYGTTPIELCKIGNYQDYFYKDSGKWYLHKEIGKVVLNGSENWTYQSNVNACYTQNNDFMRTSDYTNLIYSNYYASGISQGATGNYYITGYSSSGSLGQNWFYIRNIDITNANDLKTWLSTHNTEVYYVLSTPTNEPIPSNLINQLEELYIAKSKENQTNISQINNDLGFIISASALKKGV